MRIILELYIFVCLMLLLFNIIFLLTKKFSAQKIYSTSNTIEEQTEKERALYNPEQGLSTSYQALLGTKLRKVKHLIALQNTLDAMDHPNEHFLLDIRSIVFRQIHHYQKKPDYEQAYYTYVVSRFDYRKIPVDDRFAKEFLAFLDSKSLYTFTNTMNALYQFGEPHLMLQGIKTMDERDGFYHKKLFIDGLMEYRGDTELLHKIMIEDFFKYKYSTQSSILDYFRLNGVEASAIGLEVLANPQAKEEVLYSAMRYFAKYPHDEAKEYFMNVLQDKETIWVKELLALQGLKPYPDRAIKELMKAKVSSPNWYVRKDAIGHLHHHQASKFDLYPILLKMDRYANEAILYEYRDEIDMVNYVKEIIGNFDEQPLITDKFDDPSASAGSMEQGFVLAQ